MRIIAEIATHINIIMERIDITDKITLYNCDFSRCLNKNIMEPIKKDTNENCRIKVSSLSKQNSNWDITSIHTFVNRKYEVDNNGNFYRNGEIVKVKPDKKENQFVLLFDDNNNKVRFKTYQIIAQTFYYGLLKNGFSIDHIDRDRLNNKISNLRIVDRKTQCENRENIIYKEKQVLCTNNGVIYTSCKDAENELNLTKNTVSRVARGDRKKIHGYKFIFIK